LLSRIACRKEPEPESLVLVTVNVVGTSRHSKISIRGVNEIGLRILAHRLRAERRHSDGNRPQKEGTIVHLLELEIGGLS